MNYSFKSLDYLLLTFLILPHYPVLFTSVSALCQYLFETNCPILLIVLLSVSVMGSDIAIRHHAWLSTLYQPVGCMPSKLLRIYFKTKQNCSRPQLLSCGMLSVSKICFLLCIISYWLYCLQICYSNILWVKVCTKILKSNYLNWIILRSRSISVRIALLQFMFDFHFRPNICQLLPRLFLHWHHCGAGGLLWCS